MKTVLVTALAVIALASEAYAAGRTPASDGRTPASELVCYVLEDFPAERLKLDVKSHSALSEKRENPQQTAYSVHGKHTIAPDMTTATGTVVTASGEGAHMGIESTWSRENDSARSVTFDCTSEETDQAPDTWTCFIRNDFGVFWGQSRLTEVKNEADDPACGIFEDGVMDASSKSLPSGSTPTNTNPKK